MNRAHLVLALALASTLAACGGTTTTPDGGGACVRETDQAYCQRLGKTCELITGFDNCGAGRTVNCGSCTLPDTCGGGGVPNVCGSVAVDSGQPAPDAGVDSGVPDAGVDSGVPDAGVDSGVPDAGVTDGGCAIACPTAPHYFKGTFLIDTNQTVVNGTPYTHAFDGVVGETISYVISFDVTNQQRSPGYGVMNDRLVLTCTGPDFFFSGDASGVMNAVKNNLQNRPPPSCSLESRNFTPASVSYAVGGAGFPRYTLELNFTPSSLTYGPDHVPNLAAFTAASSTMILRRFAADGGFTDYASGTATLRFDTP